MGRRMKRCPGSGETQMLAWLPDDKGYPGAVVCLECSGGIMVRKGSTYPATSQSGFEGLAGTVRVHYVDSLRARHPRISYRKS